MNHYGFVKALLKRLDTRSLRPTQWYSTRQKQIHTDRRQHREQIWIPTVNIHKNDSTIDTTQLLVRARYLRQAYAGIFHMLPLGLRVQEKLERLIDKHMSTVGASKVSLSSISSQKLWQRSGRLKTGSELFKFADRKDGKWLLAPTHEEEITTLLAELISSPNDLPVRLYQISRKYRDEKRPRGGLLRGREFIMKDLYTFDKNLEDAIVTYDQIRSAYRNFLDELKVKYVEARADSGDMGGDLSHEYHFPSVAGEDNLITCSNCGHARNEEFVNPVKVVHQKVELPLQSSHDTDRATETFTVQDVVSKDGEHLVRILAPTLPTSKNNSNSLNYFAIKAAFEGQLELDTGIEDPLQVFNESSQTKQEFNGSSSRAIHYLLDGQVKAEEAYKYIRHDVGRFSGDKIDVFIVNAAEDTPNPLNLLKPVQGDSCPSCKIGSLEITKAIEIGHTFHLGRRYSSKLGLSVRHSDQGSQTGELVPVEMGCHGIGVSRLIAAVASCLSDEKGLNWPRIIAPFEVAILVNQTDAERMSAAEKLYDILGRDHEEPMDVLIDDRREQGLIWKLKDADIIGYPVLIVLGKSFDRQYVEVQCRRLGVKEDVNIEDAPAFVRKLLKQL